MRASSTLLFSFAIAALLLGGCSSTPQDRITQNRAMYEAFPSDVQRKVSAGEVGVGFTYDMVFLALGKPDQKFTRAEAGGQTEVWVYKKEKPQISFGIGMGSGSYGGGSSHATGVGVSTTTMPSDEYMRVAFRDGRVSSVEKSVNN